MNEINYIGILDYLVNNRGVEYADPEKSGLTTEQIEKYLNVKKKGQDTAAELKKIVNLCKNNYDLIQHGKISWLDGTNKKTRKYLWGPMKYKNYTDRRESISIFVEMDTQETPVFRVSLELKNDEAKLEDVKNYHRHLEIPINTKAGLVYVSGSNENGSPTLLNESQEVIKQKLENKEYTKVQICKYISKADYPTNEAIESGILEAVEALLPYYEHVVVTKEEQEHMNTNNKVIEYDKNMILYGPPGTGKTYSTAKYAVEICDGENTPDLNDYTTVMERYRELISEGRIAFVTFHQSYGYEEFIEGIKPLMDKNSDDDGNTDGEIKYDVVDGVFKNFCNKARSSDESAEPKTATEKNNMPYVFVIDEINRGNISKIFGELITLIEDTKREGLEECIPAKLPYSGDEFMVPDNVYLLGTMNTADRSIALMDTALRRRFKFKEMLPDHNLLTGVTIEEDGESIDIGEMLKIINKRIMYLYDREHTIGHAIFMKLKKNGENTMTNLASIFSNSVMPLLQEYFYDDYEKIRFVLGDNAKETTATQFVIAEDVPYDTFEGDVSDYIDIPEKHYQITYENFKNIKSYKEISKYL